MKHLSCFVVLGSSLLLSAFAFAATANSVSQRASGPTSSLGDLTFFPEAKTYVNTTSISYTYAKFSFDFPADTGSVEFNSREFQLSDRIDYSFLKNQDISLTVNYAEQYGRAENALGSAHPVGSSEGAARGFKNPVFGYKIRVLEPQKNNNPFNLDLEATFAPNFIDAKTAVNGNDGTVASGNNIFAIAANLNGRSNEIQWSVNPKIIYHGDQTTKPVDSTVEAKTDSYISFALAGQGKYSFSKKLLLDFGVNYAFVPSTNVKWHDDKFDDTSFAIYGINVGLTNIVIPNKVVAFFKLNAEKAASHDVSIGGKRILTVSNQLAVGPEAGVTVVFD